MPPVIQMTFQMHVLGAAVVTQIANPFLGGDEQLHSNITFQTTDNSTSDPMQTLYQLVGELDAILAFTCMLTFMFSCVRAGRCCIGVAVCLREADDNEDVQLIPDSTDNDQKDAQRSRADYTVEACSRNGYILLSIIYVFLLMINAHDLLLHNLLFTYVYEYLGWSVGHSTILLFVYFQTRFVIGALAVPVSRWVSPTQLLIFDLTTLVVAGILMLVAVVLGGTFTVVGVILSAVGSCSVTPTTITFVEKTIHVIAPVMSLLLSTLGFSKFGVSLAGTLLYYTGDASYPAMILVLSTVSLLMFVFYKVFCRVMTSSSSSSVKSNDDKQSVTTSGNTWRAVTNWAMHNSALHLSYLHKKDIPLIMPLFVEFGLRESLTGAYLLPLPSLPDEWYRLRTCSCVCLHPPHAHPDLISKVISIALRHLQTLRE